MNGDDIAVRIRGLSKAFGRAPALRGIDLDVPAGATLSLLGHNGSGKTTLIRVVASLTRPDAGEVWALGVPLRTRGASIRRMIGLVGHDPLLYDDLTARENLRFACRVFGIGWGIGWGVGRGAERADERIEEVSAAMGMSAYLDRKAGAMSHGMRKRFSIARALLHDPPILLLDEPESGLDQEAVGLLDAIISRRDAGRTVIMTTHDPERAVALGDRVAALQDGRVVYDGALSPNGSNGDEVRRLFAPKLGSRGDAR